jgi:hypothetical protein
MSRVFSAAGSVMVLLTGISPEAEKVISKKTTMINKKSIMLVRLSEALTERRPAPDTFFCTKASEMACIKRRPGLLIMAASAPQLEVIEKVTFMAGKSSPFLLPGKARFGR